MTKREKIAELIQDVRAGQRVCAAAMRQLANMEESLALAAQALAVRLDALQRWEAQLMAAKIEYGKAEQAHSFAVQCKVNTFASLTEAQESLNERLETLNHLTAQLGDDDLPDINDADWWKNK